MGLLTAEIRKLTTVRTTWVLTAVGALLVAITAGVFTFVSDVSPPFDGSQSQVANAVGRIGTNSAIVLIVGLLVMTTEFRYGTIGRTLQVTPSRSRVLVAKLTTGALYAGVFLVVGLAVVGGLLGVGAAVQELGLELGAEVWTATWQSLVALVLTAMLGVAIGALLRGQVLALSVTLVWVFLLEGLVQQLVPSVGRWLPFQALQWMFVDTEALAATTGTPMNVDPLPPALALAIFLGYVLAATTTAAVQMRTRDV